MKDHDTRQAHLAQLEAAHALRVLQTQPAPGGVFSRDGRRILNFSTNDYLNFTHHPAIREAMETSLHEQGTGSGASRLVTGTLPSHTRLETAFAEHKGYPAALAFGSGYMTNLGVVDALAGRHDTVITDQLIHASILDAVRMSGARVLRYRHNNPEDLETLLLRSGDRTALVVTESVFSMDGDIAPLSDVAAVCRRHDVPLMVDEAHAGGIFGPHGAGLVALHGLQPDVTLSMGTFSKALGGYGGAVACSSDMREWLINKSRPFIYTTAPPPALAAGAVRALELLHEQPELGRRLLTLADTMRQLLQDGGADTMASDSQIIPVLIGENEPTVRIDRQLREEGIIAAALRSPTVPPGKARLRLSVTLAHTEDDIRHAAGRILTVMRDEGVL